MTEAPCVDATCSADSSTSTGELHERLYVPHRTASASSGFWSVIGYEVHGRVRRGLCRRGDRGAADAGPGTAGERLRGAVGGHRAARAAGPAADLRRLAAAGCAGRV